MNLKEELGYYIPFFNIEHYKRSEEFREDFKKRRGGMIQIAKIAILCFYNLGMIFGVPSYLARGISTKQWNLIKQVQENHKKALENKLNE